MFKWSIKTLDKGFLAELSFKKKKINLPADIKDLSSMQLSMSDQYNVMNISKEIEMLCGFNFDLKFYKDLFSDDIINTELVAFVDGDLFISFLGIYIIRTGIKGEEIPSPIVDFFDGLGIPSYELLTGKISSRLAPQNKDYNLVLDIEHKNQKVEVLSLTDEFAVLNNGEEVFLYPEMVRFLNNYIAFHKFRKSKDFQESQVYRRELSAQLISYAKAAKIEINKNILVNSNYGLEGLSYRLMRDVNDEILALPLLRNDFSSYEFSFFKYINNAATDLTLPLHQVSNDKGEVMVFILDAESSKKLNKIRNFNNLSSLEKETYLANPESFFGEMPSVERELSLSSRVDMVLFGKLKSDSELSASGNDWYSAFEGDTSFIVKNQDGSIQEILEKDQDGVLERLLGNNNELTFEVNGNTYNFDADSAKDYVEKLVDARAPLLNEDDLDYARDLIQDAEIRNIAMVSWNDNSIPAESLKKSVRRAESLQKSLDVKSNYIHLVPSSADKNKIVTGEALESLINFTNPNCFLESMNLKKHQFEGLNFLRKGLNSGDFYQADGSRGVMIADDMGVGKTAQVLGHVSDFVSSNNWREQSILLVAPLSLIKSSWINDGFKKFFQEKFLYDEKNSPMFVNYKDAPKVNRKELVEFLHSLSDEERLSAKYPIQIQEQIIDLEKWSKSKVVMMSYETLRANSFVLSHIPFDLVILDEAQKIKNRGSQQSNAAKCLKAKRKIAMTGTPIENTIMELWNLMDFVFPGQMGSREDFRARFHTKLDQLESNSPERIEMVNELKEMLSPFFLRRSKKDLSEQGSDFDLPKIIHHDDVSSPFYQVPLSESQVVSYKNALVLKNNGAGGASSVRRLIDVCSSNWMSLPEPHNNYSQIEEYIQDTPKLGLLFKILDHIQSLKDSQKGVLLFCNRKDLQRNLKFLIEAWLEKKYNLKRDVFIYNGDAGELNREKAVRNFQNSKDEFNLLILSPKAGGVGLNLQKASHIIHYTREWNPATENQANCRAYRSGQKNDVHVYYPTSVGKDFKSAEENLALILNAKREIVDDFTVTVRHMAIEETDIIGEHQDSDSAYPVNPLSLSDVKLLHPSQFEELVTVLYQKRGYNAKRVGRPGDGGVDVTAYKDGVLHLIQVKHSEKNKKLGVAAVSEIVGADTSAYSAKAFKREVFTNLGQLSRVCEVEANKKGVKVHTANALADLLAQHPVFITDLK